MCVPLAILLRLSILNFILFQDAYLTGKSAEQVESTASVAAGKTGKPAKNVKTGKAQVPVEADLDTSLDAYFSKKEKPMAASAGTE